MMIAGTGTISNYAGYTSNCVKGQYPYKIPVTSLNDAQLYIDIGTLKPTTATYELIHTCGPLGGTVESVTPGSYVIGQDKGNNWFGVFKDFGSTTANCFVIAITLDAQIYFSEEYCIEPSCNTLSELKGCYGNVDSLLAHDCNGIYFGYHAGTGDALGDTTVRYEHKMLLRAVEINIEAIKNVFKQGLTRNFRTEKQKVYKFLSEFIPEWYLSEVDAIFYRGEVYVDSVRYLVDETLFEKIDDCKKIWKVPSSLKEYCFKSFTCETDSCAAPIVQTECCDPEIVSVSVVEVPFESGTEESGGGGGGDTTTSSRVIVVQAVVDGTPSVTGTFDPVTGITTGSSVVSCAAFANKRVYVERGSFINPGIDPGDGSQWHTKVFTDAFITFSTPLVSGEFIYIETIL